MVQFLRRLNAVTPRTEDINTGWISKAASKVIENLINLNISISYFLVTHIVVLLSLNTGNTQASWMDKIFSRDFENWILILLKIYITPKKMAEFKMAESKMADIIGKK